MKKRIIILFGIGIIAVSIMIGYGSLDEKAYNTIMVDYISSEILRQQRTFEEKVRKLRSFVHQNVSPVHGEECRPDTVAVDKLVSGIGWCDQMSRVFMQLAKTRGITTRLLFLLDEKGSSPHTIAEAWDGRRWVIVDTAYDLDIYNGANEMASAADIKNDPRILSNNPKIKMFGRYNPIWNDENYLSIYYRTPEYINKKDGRVVRMFDFLPSVLKKAFVYSVQDLYILKKKKDFSSDAEFLYFKARNYQLAGRLKKSENIYRDILGRNDTVSVKDKTRFFLALLLKEEKRYDEALGVITDLISDPKNTSWVVYAYGLRASIYGVLGDGKNADKDFQYFAGSPDAYF